jgi:uncharacterized membrane protein YhaH (DUF805 family)
MENHSPYYALWGKAGSPNYERCHPKIFSIVDRIGRVRFLALQLGLIIPAYTILYLANPSYFHSAEVPAHGSPFIWSVSAVIGETAMSLLPCFALVFGKRRLNDANRTGWWMVLSFFYVNDIAVGQILLLVFLLIAPGSRVTNDYGLAPIENSKKLIVTTLLLALLLALPLVLVQLPLVNLPSDLPQLLR